MAKEIACHPSISIEITSLQGGGQSSKGKEDQRIFCPTHASNELQRKDGIIGSLHPLWVSASTPSSQTQQLLQSLEASSEHQCPGV